MGRHEHGHFSWIDLSAGDMESQSAFYEGLFGWTHNDVPAGEDMIYRMFQMDGEDVAGAGDMPTELAASGMPPMWQTYVTVDDVDAIAVKAEELGGKVIMPAMDVMDSGRMLGVSDPTGAAIMFWQSAEDFGASKYDEPGSLVWNDLNTRDLAAAADFYEALLGWSVNRDSDNEPPYWQISIGDESEAGMMLMGEQFPPEVPAHWLVYFAVEDARATTDKARELGGTVDLEPMDIPGIAVISVISDPSGATFALMQNLM